MSDLPSIEVVAIACSDLHLSHKPPVWRSAEPDWYAAMDRPLNELDGLSRHYHAPIICAGDIFDRWNSPPELINFALHSLPEMMATVPGQHDLPLHNYEDVHKSAYWSLHLADKIMNCDTPEVANFTSKFNFCNIVFVPFGEQIKPIKPEKDKINILVAHEYTWTAGYKYPNALDAMSVSTKKELLKGYDIAIFGDNHKGFHYEKDGLTVFNCGSFMRRHADQKDYRPMVGLITYDKKVVPYYLDISEDKYIDTELSDKDLSERYEGLDVESFIEVCKALETDSFDYISGLRQYMITQNTRASVIKEINTIIEEIQ